MTPEDHLRMIIGDQAMQIAMLRAENEALKAAKKELEKPAEAPKEE
jgi:hypothetical protein